MKIIYFLMTLFFTGQIFAATIIISPGSQVTTLERNTTVICKKGELSVPFAETCYVPTREDRPYIWKNCQVMFNAGDQDNYAVSKKFNYRYELAMKWKTDGSCPKVEAIADVSELVFKYCKK